MLPKEKLRPNPKPEAGKPSWVAIEDGLPKESGFVLATRLRDSDLRFPCAVVMIWFDAALQKFYLEKRPADGGPDYIVYKNQVTAWMPLPPPFQHQEAAMTTIDEAKHALDCYTGPSFIGPERFERIAKFASDFADQIAAKRVAEERMEIADVLGTILLSAASYEASQMYLTMYIDKLRGQQP
jgi:hypothetical protein